jgi:hypothetical protein
MSNRIKKEDLQKIAYESQLSNVYLKILSAAKQGEDHVAVPYIQEWVKTCLVEDGYEIRKIPFNTSGNEYLIVWG